MYYIVKYRDSGNIYLMEDVEGGKGLLRILEYLRIVKPEQLIPKIRPIIPLDLYRTDVHYISGGEEILGIATLEML